MPKSRDFRRIVIISIILFIICVLGLFIILEYNLANMSRDVTKQNVAIVGAVLSQHPELEEEVVKIVTKEIPEEQVILGKEVLEKYNYNNLVGHRNQIAMILTSTNMRNQLLILTSSLFAIGIGVYLYGMKQLSNKIERLYIASERVINGDFRVRLTEDGEGSISILNHQFNKMSNIIKKNYEILNSEKSFLKDTISDISHQLKTPLASLVMFNELMLDDEDMDPETRRAFLEKSKIQYDRMEWLIINLLKIARIEAGAIEFKRDQVSVEDLIQASVKAVEAKLMQNNQSVVVVGDTDIKIICDFKWTEEAITNIIKNATEYAPTESDIVVRIQKNPTTSTITIKNTGPQIDPNEINYVFRRFYKSSSSMDSVGIGLNLTKSIIEGQGGVIAAQNVTDGVEFIITFMNSSYGIKMMDKRAKLKAGSD